MPEVVPLQLMLDDVHTQGPNLEMCDQAMELGETRGENEDGEREKDFHLSKSGFAKLFSGGIWDSSWELSLK